MEKEELEVIKPSIKYDIGTRLLPPNMTLEVVKETDGCYGCFFETIDCGGIFNCENGIIFKPVFDEEE